MTRDEVLSMARKVKLEVAFDFDYRCSFEAMTAPEQDRLVQLEQFAALVEAHEREACALVCDEQMTREPYGHAKHAAGQCAENIRARATTPKETS